ncbi:MAG: GIN domain-containing protein [Janthinobacterium lividum]
MTIDKALSDIRLSRISPEETLPQSASGDPIRRFSIEGDTLNVDLPCAGTVTLLPTADLGKDATLSVRHGQNEMLQAVATDGGMVSQLNSCHGGNDADFILRVDPSRSLRIVQHGDVDIHGGRFTGPVAIDGSGSGTVRLASVGRLVDHQRGSGDVVIDEISGELDVELLGSGELQIKQGQVSRMSVTGVGSGDVSTGGATVDTAHVELTGSGDLTMGMVTGRLDASTLGSGDITIRSVTADAVRLIGSGSGDIAIRAGTIGKLTAVRRGSGDLTIQAIIGSGTSSHHGSGDVSLPHVTGSLARTGGDDDDHDDD